MGCTSGAMKCVLNIMNSLLALIGIALIALATLSLQTAPPVYIYYMYIVGGVSLLASLLGCCGICQEDVCMTTTYAVIILISLIGQVIGKIYASDFDAIKNFASDDVKKSWLEEVQHPGAMDRTQQTYQCCGKNGPSDYMLIGRLDYPKSCYSHVANQTQQLFGDGCIFAAEREFEKVFKITSSGEWGSLIITGIMFLFALYLVMRFRSRQNRYMY